MYILYVMLRGAEVILNFNFANGYQILKCKIQKAFRAHYLLRATFATINLKGQ